MVLIFNTYEFLVEIMDKKSLNRIVSQVKKQNSLFSDKSFLDNLSMPGEILGREDHTKRLVECLLGYQKGLVVPVVSVYGRSGSGKSSLVRFVCQNLDELSFVYVNLRKAKTVFGCANLILSELGQPELKSASGLNAAIEKIDSAISEKVNAPLFVLCLDEFDSIFLDKRGAPSDFVYKLILLIEKFRTQQRHMCIITISNKILSDFDLDDRVLSRIGSSEIFFDSYSEGDVFEILKSRAEKAFSVRVPDKILKHVAKLSSSDHGDARRAIDLLRLSAELAGQSGSMISESHVDSAASLLQQDQVTKIIKGGSYHFRVVCAALSRITYLSDEPWHSTSRIYKQYQKVLQTDTKPLSYRRVSELLVELVNSGIAVSQTSSKGRKGYGSQFKLVVAPDIVGNAASEKWWSSIVAEKAKHQETDFRVSTSSDSAKMLAMLNKKNWDDFMG